MRLTALCLLSALVLVACGEPTPSAGPEAAGPVNESPAPDPAARAAIEDPAAVRLKVEGMSCAHNCAPEVQRLLSQLEGIKAAAVVFEEKTAYLSLENPARASSEVAAAAREALAQTRFSIAD